MSLPTSIPNWLSFSNRSFPGSRLERIQLSLLNRSSSSEKEKKEIETTKSERKRDEERVAALRESVEKAKDKVLAYDEQLVRNFIEEIRVFPAKLTITVKGGAKEDIII